MNWGSWISSWFWKDAVASKTGVVDLSLNLVKIEERESLIPPHDQKKENVINELKEKLKDKLIE